MRRIYIDEIIHHWAKEYASVILGKGSSRLTWRTVDFPINRLNKFYTSLMSCHYDLQASYVKEIADNLSEIITLNPDSFDDFHRNHFARFGDECLKVGIKDASKTTPFYKLIIECMRYEDIRNLIRKYISKMEIKTCIYCNAQYAVTTEECEIDGEKKRIGTYQLDHFYDKARYPYLCVSFFNLHPCCSTCNQSKGTRRSLFNLYCNKQDDVDVFEFRLTPEKALDAWISDNITDLSVELFSENKELLKNHNRLFYIDLIYEQHLDVVVRIIRLLHWYDSASQEALNDSLNDLFPNGVEDPEYFFFGYHMKKEQVHYQPLSKLVQDVVSQLRS